MMLLQKIEKSAWINYRSTLLGTTAVKEICFLKDILCITNILFLVLQTDKKGLGAISRSFNVTISMLEPGEQLEDFKGAL